VTGEVPDADVDLEATACRFRACDGDGCRVLLELRDGGMGCRVELLTETMISMQRILCPLDFSSYSGGALQYAVAFSRWSDA
jgi:hypothetical protein